MLSRERGKRLSETSGHCRFRADGRFFIYDRYTNQILEINKNVYQIADDYFSLTPDRLHRRYSTQMTENQLNDAIRWLDQVVHKRRLFRPTIHGDYSKILDRDFLKQGLSTGMRNLCLTVTEQCNQRCTYCVNSGNYQGEFVHSNRHMTWEVARRCVDYFLPRTEPGETAGLSFFGGEPMLGWDVVQKCIRHVRTHYGLADNLYMTIVTNATLLTPRSLDFIMKNDVGLQFSLDGPKFIHDASRVFADGSGTYERVMASLREIRRKNPEYYSKRVTIACCIDRNKSLIELFRFFNTEEFEGIKVSFNPIKEDDNGYYVEDENTRQHYGSEVELLIGLYLSSLRSGGRFHHPLFRELLFRVFKLGWDPITPRVARGRFPNPICLPGISKIYVASDGTFYPCERFRLRGAEIGDYRTGVDLEKVRALVQMFSDFCAENCGACWAHGLCCHCYVHFLDGGKIRREKKLDYCRREKEALVEGFQRFVYIWENEPRSARRNPDSLHSHLEKVRYSVLHSLKAISNS